MNSLRRQRLTRERIARAALEIIEEQGNFTMDAVASRLAVRTPSLYNHVSGRADVERLVVARLHEQLAARLDPSAPWNELIRIVAYTQRRIFVAFPHYILELGRTPARLDSTITSLELLADALLRDGFTLDLARRVIQAVDLLVIGGAVDATVDESIYPPSVVAGQGVLQQVLGETNATPEDVFEFALGCLLDGFERHRLGGTP